MTKQKSWEDREGSLIGGLLLVGIGTFFLLNQLKIIDVGIDKLWPVVLIIIGIGLIVGHFRGPRSTRGREKTPTGEIPPGD